MKIIILEILFGVLYLLKTSSSLTQRDENNLAAIQKLLIPSLFPYVSPSIRFLHNQSAFSNPLASCSLPYHLSQHLFLGKINSLQIKIKPHSQWLKEFSALLRRTSCFSEENAEKAPWTIALSLFAITTPKTKTLKDGQKPVVEKPYQKYNRMPGTHLFNKLTLWQTAKRLNGNQDPTYLLQTFLLPNEFDKFKEEWKSSPNKLWIIKPPNGAMSNGVKLINHPAQAYKIIKTRKGKQFLAQPYMRNPKLINGRRSEVRTYVLITSAFPLRAYMTFSGYAKIGHQNYTVDENDISNPCKYIQLYTPEQCNSTWENKFMDNTIVWKKWFGEDRWAEQEKVKGEMRKIVIKTLLGAEKNISRKAKNELLNRYNAYELLSFDFFVDENFGVFLNEVNTHPYIVFDKEHGSRVIHDVLTVSGFQLPPPISTKGKVGILKAFPGIKLDDPTFDERIFKMNLSQEEKAKHLKFGRGTESDKILDDLTPDDVRQLIIAEDESNRAVNTSFFRIYPSLNLKKFLGPGQKLRFWLDHDSIYYHKLFIAWEGKYGKDNVTRKEGRDRLAKLASAKYHLKI